MPKGVPRNYTQPKLSQARSMRKSPSAAEDIAWGLLRRNQTGFCFRRQHAIGSYILDFYCSEAKVALELDGEQHDPQRDAQRDAWFLKQGIVTMRVPNRDFFNLDGKPSFWLSELVRLCEARTGRRAFPHE